MRVPARARANTLTGGARRDRDSQSISYGKKLAALESLKQFGLVGGGRIIKDVNCCTVQFYRQ